jgi:hypothetical protein
LGWRKLGLERRLGARLVISADDLVILWPERRCGGRQWSAGYGAVVVTPMGYFSKASKTALSPVI